MIRVSNISNANCDLFLIGECPYHRPSRNKNVNKFKKGYKIQKMKTSLKIMDKEE